MLEWLNHNQAVVWSLAATSIIMFVATLFIVPAIIVRIRSDYFAYEQRPASRWAHLPPAARTVVHVLKNILGALLMIAGLAMLALPGQGLLTMLVGFFLLDFPGKYRFERWLIARPAVHRPINWLRRRAAREPLQLDHNVGSS